MSYFTTIKSVATVCGLMCASAAMAGVVPSNVTPAAGFLSSLHEVEVTFPGTYKSVEFSERALLYYDPDEKVDKEGIIYFASEEVDQSEDMYSASISGSTVKFVSKEVWNKVGKCSLMIPAGAIIFTNEDGKKTTNNLINIIWKVCDVANPIVTPAAGIVADLSEVSVSLPAGYTWTGGYPGMAQFQPKLYRSNEFGEKVDGNNAIARFPLLNTGAWKGTQEVVFGAPVDFYSGTPYDLVDGQWYVLEVLQSSLIETNEKTEAYSYVLPIKVLYHYVKEKNIDDLVSLLYPAEKVTDADDPRSEFGMAYIEWDLASDQIEVNRKSPEMVKLFFEGKLVKSIDPTKENQVMVNRIATAADEPEATVQSSVSFIFLDKDPAEVTAADLAPYKQIGKYHLVVPDGVLTYAGAPLPGKDVYYEYSINSGVDEVAADAVVTVYSIDGKVLLHNAERSALGTLAPGLYIVNGQKLVIK